MIVGSGLGGFALEEDKDAKAESFAELVSVCAFSTRHFSAASVSFTVWFAGIICCPMVEMRAAGVSMASSVFMIVCWSTGGCARSIACCWGIPAGLLMVRRGDCMLPRGFDATKSLRIVSPKVTMSAAVSASPPHVSLQSFAREFRLC